MATDAENRKKWETENPWSTIPDMDLYAGLDFSTPAPMQPTQGPIPTTAPTNAPTTPGGGTGGGSGGDPIDVAPPIPPSIGGLQSMGDSVQAAQQVIAPGSMRQGLSQRIPPSLAALLKAKVY